MSDRDRVQLLLWRAWLGATSAQVDQVAALGYAGAVNDVLNYPDAPAVAPSLPAWPDYPGSSATAAQLAAYNDAVNQANDNDLKLIQPWWTGLLRGSGTPLQENLTLFWHNHFATANDKVHRPPYMLQQNQLLRTSGAGKFVDLLTAVAKDPAMLIYLDGRYNVKGHPNENWAREAMELFSLGIGNYTETDVREAARACSGWTLAYTGTVTFDTTKWDGGAKTILGQTGNFNMDDFCRLLAVHPATAKHICTKLFVWFVGDTPTDAELAPMLSAWNASGGTIREVLRAMFVSDAFQPARAFLKFAKNPVAWTIGIVRGLGVTIADTAIFNAMNQQGLQLFYPPNVGGWPHGTAWISPSTQVLRFNLAGSLLNGLAGFTGVATDAWVTTLGDSLGGLPINATLHGKLVTLGNRTNGQTAVAQIVLAGPDYQAQ